MYKNFNDEKNENIFMVLSQRSPQRFFLWSSTTLLGFFLIYFLSNSLIFEEKDKICFTNNIFIERQISASNNSRTNMKNLFTQTEGIEISETATHYLKKKRIYDIQLAQIWERANAKSIRVERLFYYCDDLESRINTDLEAIKANNSLQESKLLLTTMELEQQRVEGIRAFLEGKTIAGIECYGYATELLEKLDIKYKI